MLKLLAIVGAGLAGLLVAGVAVFLATDSDSGDADGSATAVATPATGLTAEALLQQAAQRAGELTSFHFELTHENGSTPLPLNLELTSAEGDVVVPGRLRAEVDAEASGFDVSVDVVGIDDQTWVTNPFTRDWQELPGTNIRDFADPAALVSGLLPSVENPTLGEPESIGGVDTHMITGEIDSGLLQTALGFAEPGRSVTVETWLGQDDLLPRRVRLVGPLSDSESGDVVRQVDLSRFNEPVEIMPPE